MTTLLTPIRKKQLVSFLLILTMVCFLFFASAEFSYASLNPLTLLKSSILRLVWFFTVAFPAFLTFITGTLLNVTIFYFVVDMGNQVNVHTGVGYAINSLWRVIRDTMNILFIFGLIYIGIKTILNSEDSGTRKALIHLIGAALLINFSLFIAKAVIDFSNVIAAVIFAMFSQTSEVDLGNLGVYGVSGAFMQSLGILSMLGTSNNFEFENINLMAGIVYSLMTMLFLLITTVVFAAGAFMLTARFIALVIYMIFSPIMFLGWVLPSFASYSTNWWDGFFKKAFFAPAYLFMLYLSYITLERFSVGIGTRADLGEIMNTGLTGGIAPTVLMFVFAAGMLIASIIVAQKMSIAGAGTTMNVMQGLRKGIQNNTKSLAGRRSIGRVGNWMAKKTEENESSEAGRKRNARITALTGGLFDTQSRIKAGKAMRSNTFGGSRSFESQEAWSKERAKLEATGEQTSKTKSVIQAFMDDPSEDNRKAMERQVKDAPTSHIVEMAKSSKDRKFVEAVAGELTESQWKAITDDKEINDKIKKDLGGKRGSQVEERLLRINEKDKLEEAIHKADISELKSLGLDKVLPFAEFMTSKQIEDWKDLTPTEKSQIKKARKTQLEARFLEAGGASTVFNRFKSDTERSKLPTEILTSGAATLYLNKNVLTKIVDNDGISDDDRTVIREKIEMRFPAGTAEGDKWQDWFSKNNAGQRY